MNHTNMKKCEDCKGEGTVEQGRHDNIIKVKCHCNVPDEMDDDS